MAATRAVVTVVSMRNRDAMRGIALSMLVAVGAVHDAEAQRERRERPGSPTVEVRAPADAPSPPAQPIKKSQAKETSKHPARREIKVVEDAIYTMEKPRATVWAWKEDPGGDGTRDMRYVERAMEELRAAMAALKAAAPDWPRLAEYEQRITHLEAAAAAQRRHYGAVAKAKEDAAAAAAAADQAAWEAKRSPDEGTRSGFHQQAAGTIVFGKAPVDDQGTGALTATDVAAPLHVRAFLSASPWNLLHTAGIDCSTATTPDRASLEDYWIRTWVQINGGDPVELETLDLSRADFQRKTTSPLTMVGSLTKGGTYGNPDEPKMAMAWLAKVAATLKPGANKVVLEARAWCYGAPHTGVPIARGELAIQASEAQLTEVGKRATFTLAPSVHPAAKLTRWRDALAKRYAAEWTVLELRTAGEFKLQRNDLGVVLSRDAPAIALIKRKGRQECQLVSVILSEPFDGRTYGPQLELAYVNPRPFVCQYK